MSTIALILDNENWSQAEVAQEFQDIIDSLYGIPKSESESKIAGISLLFFCLLFYFFLFIASFGLGAYFVLRAEGEEFCIVNSALMFLKTLDEYLHIVKLIPSVGHEILNGLTEILSVIFFLILWCQFLSYIILALEF